MRQRALLTVLFVALAGSAGMACYAETAGNFDDDGNGNTQNADPDAAPPLDDAGKPVATGVPCEIETILSKYCWSCHGVTPTAPSRLVTYSDLTGPSASNKNVSEAAEALARMQSTTAPMPSKGAKPTANELATFSAWVSAQTPQGPKCGGGSSDGGTLPEDAAPPPNPYATPVQCTSNKTWKSGTGSTMRPGDACKRCHSSFSIGGTVYPTAHEPTNCLGIPAGATVVVTDAANKTVNLTVNSAGNFYYSSYVALKAPFTVSVTNGSKTRAMTGKAPNGDCNSCHTQTGTQNAPGRIMAP
jgi:cytochrome c553